MQPDLFAADARHTALDKLHEDGLLRDLDVAVAHFLAEQQADLNPAVALIAALTSAQLAAGHLCLDLAEPALTERLWPDGMPAPVATLLPADAALWRPPLAASPVVQEAGSAANESAPLVLDGERLYLRRYWRQETAVAHGIHERLPSLDPALDSDIDTAEAVPADLSQRLAALFPAPSATLDDSPLDDNIPNDSTPDWQKIACALATRARLALITGGPGTGKTTTVVKLLGLLQGLALEETGRRLRIRLAAPTGKAAARLAESIGEQVARLPVGDAVRDAIPDEVSTLHRLLGTRPDSRHFRHHRHNPLHADLVVVDEASMIDMAMMACLLDALGPQTRLVLLGDKDQLASVEAGAVMGDLCRGAEAGHYHPATLAFLHHNTGADLADCAGNGSALAQQTIMLRKNWRFRDSPGIGELATAINAGDYPASEAVLAAGHSGLIRHRADRQHLAARLCELLLDGGLRDLLATCNAPAEEPDDIDNRARNGLAQLARQQLLSGLRDGPFGVNALNDEITERLRRQGLVGQGDWYPGRPVMLTRNDYQLGLMNGDVGLTLPCRDGLRVAFTQSDGQIRWVLPSRLDAVETVYAMTVHKSQGSEFGHALLVLPDHPHPLLTRELVYTAVTRARHAFTLVECGSHSVLEQAIQRRTWRASGLAERLHGR